MILGIFGAGGLGREVEIIAKKINAIENRWNEIVFVDDDESIMQVMKTKCDTFQNSISKYTQLEISIAIGEPSTREKVYKKCKDNNIPIATLIHPGVYIDETTRIGEGTVICEGCTITSCVEFGVNCYIQPHAIVGHDIKIGNHCVISAGCQIGGANIIGDRTYIGFLGGTKQGLTIGKDVICSGGAMVFKDLPDNVIAVGNPARIMKKNDGKGVFHK